MQDRNWINPPQIMVKKGKANTPNKLSYWTDKNGEAHLYTKEQLAACNVLTNLNYLMVKALVLLDTLENMNGNEKVRSLVQKDYTKYNASESSVFNRFINLMAAVPDITFGEFLSFLSAGSNPKALSQMGKKTLKEASEGKSKSVSTFYSSDLTNES